MTLKDLSQMLRRYTQWQQKAEKELKKHHEHL